MEAYIEARPYRDVLVRPERSIVTPARTRRRVETEARPLEHGSRVLTIGSFVAADLVAISIAVAVSLLMAGTVLEVGLVRALWPAFALLPLAYAVSGLYVGAVVHPAEEMRRVSVITTLVFGAVAGTLVFVQGLSFSAGLLLGFTWMLTIGAVTFVRVFSRIMLAHTSWWGFPVVVIGHDLSGAGVIKSLRRWPELGLRPVATLDDELAGDVNRTDLVEGVPVCGRASDAPVVALDHRIPYAILAMPDLPHRRQVELATRYSKFYQRVLVVPEIASTQMLWTSSRFFDGMLGYDIRHNHRKVAAYAFKRILDFVGAFAGLVILSPLFLGLAALIKLDSKGPIFYKQVRLGRGGRSFNVFKFRSMHVDADRKLTEILAEDPDRRAEFEEYRKLKEDPRITRIGKVLRRYSVDELPQLLNVLRGEMSLVGPRAYLPSELCSMESMEPVILQNPPGLTGLWQVSGRNNLSFEERVNLDIHYIQNWSFWLDIYIFARTLPVLITGNGAC